MMMFKVACLVGCMVSVVAGQEGVNILVNPDFEEPLSGAWYCRGECVVAITTDEVYNAVNSVLVSQRTEDWNAVTQDIDVVAGNIYKFTAMVQLKVAENVLDYQTVVLMLACNDINEDTEYVRVGESAFFSQGEWQEVGGALRLDPSYHACRIYIETAAPTEYYVDDATVVMLPDDEEWKQEALESIEQNRKSDINVKVKIPGCYNKVVEIELVQKSSSFAFGTAVNARDIVSDSKQAYQDVFYENFNWATLENALKWHEMEPNQGEIDHDWSSVALDALLSNGIKTRCHNIFWAREEWVPEWVRTKYGDELVTLMLVRLEGVMNNVKGMCDHWDVMNENLLEQFFEEHTGLENITSAMFTEAKSTDAKPVLYLNENHALDTTNAAMAIKERALQMLADDVPVGGIGLEAHITDFDIHLIKAGLDIVEEAGLPITISALAMKYADENIKAEYLEELLILLFSRASVAGINFWGFWDGNMFETEAALYTGDDVTPNAAGQMFEELIHTRWATESSTELTKSKSFAVRGYQGTYTLKVRRGGDLVHEQEFTLGENPSSVRVRIGSSGSVTARVTSAA